MLLCDFFCLIICHIFFIKTGQGCAEPIPTLCCLSVLVVLLGTEFVVLLIIDSIEGVLLLQLSGQQLEAESDLEYIHDLAHYQVRLIETVANSHSHQCEMDYFLVQIWC